MPEVSKNGSRNAKLEKRRVKQTSGQVEPFRIVTITRITETI